MREKWLGNLVGKMHVYGITYEELGKEAGITKGYVSVIINGRRKPAGIREKLEAALEVLIEKKRGS